MISQIPPNQAVSSSGTWATSEFRYLADMPAGEFR